MKQAFVALIVVAILTFTTSLFIVHVSKNKYNALQEQYNALKIEYNILATKLNPLESALIGCQATNINLQKQLDDLVNNASVVIREPISGDKEREVVTPVETSGDLCIVKNANYREPIRELGKYVNLKISTLQCDKFMCIWGCSIIGSITNNHPNLVMTDIAVNGTPINRSINPGVTIQHAVSFPLTRHFDEQLVYSWQWQ